MNKKKTILIVAICILLLLLILAAVLVMRNGVITTPDQTQNPTGGQTTQPTQTGGEPDENTTEVPTKPQSPTTPTETTASTPNNEETVARPDDTTDTPPQVEIPDTDPEKTGLEFPAEVPGHNMTIEKLDTYAGLFVEDGSNREVSDVAMLLVKNTGADAIEYTEITVKFAGETLVFHITALPSGGQLVVQEKDCKPMPASEPLEASALVVHRAKMAIAPELSVQDNGDNTLTITNLTDEMIPTARVFYKYYMEQENLYVGGIAFTVRITRLGAKGSIKVQPSHFVSANSRVVMALVYDQET